MFELLRADLLSMVSIPVVIILSLILLWIDQKYRILKNEVSNCLSYLDPNLVIKQRRTEMRTLFVGLLNKISVFIDLEIEKGLPVHKSLVADRSDYLSLNESVAQLVILTRSGDNGVEVLEVGGNLNSNEKIKKIFTKELSLLDQSTEADSTFELDSVIYSSFHKYEIQILFRQSLEMSPEVNNLSSYALWFGFNSNETLTLQRMIAAKSFAREFFAQYFQKQQIQGLHGKIARSRHNNIYKGKLISGLSHDLRSPINNLQAINTCLQDNNLIAGDGAELLSMADANIRILTELIEDLLSVAKYRAGNLSPTLENIPLTELFHELERVYQFDAKLKSLELNFEYPLKDLMVVADRRHLKRIFSNLIGNAIKYTPQGNVTLRFQDLGDFCQVSITDSGLGLSSEQLNKICRPFVRFSDQEIEGVGLGLAITKLLIELNSGKLEIYSETGKGSEFRVMIPFN